MSFQSSKLSLLKFINFAIFQQEERPSVRKYEVDDSEDNKVVLYLDPLERGAKEACYSFR